MRPRTGTSLVELLVALTLLGVGALALAATNALALRQLADSERRTVATLAARSRLARLAASPCGAQQSGSATDSARALEERWTVTTNGRLRRLSDTVIARGRVRTDTLPPHGIGLVPVTTTGRAPRTGATLIEILMTVALAAFVVATLAGLGVRQQRAASEVVQGAGMRDQLYAGLLALAADLRDAEGADLAPGASPTAIELRALIGSAVVCDTAGGTLAIPHPDATAAPSPTRLRSLPSLGDTIWALVDDVWRAAPVLAAATSLTRCDTGLGATLAGTHELGAPPGTIVIRRAEASPPLAVPVGTPVRITRRTRWALYRAASNDWWLGTHAFNPALGRMDVIQPVSGPYRSSHPDSGGLVLRYFDALGAELERPVSEPARVARVDLLVRSHGTSDPRAGARRTSTLALSVPLRPPLDASTPTTP